MTDPFEQIAQVLCRPEGTFELEYQCDAFGEAAEAGILLEVPAGGHYFRLERLDHRALRYYHSSPGTGTRAAEISLAGLPEFDRAYIALTWTPDETCFYFGPRIPDGQLLSAKGEPSDVQYRIGTDGSVMQVGDAGVDVVIARVRRNGEAVLVPTAIETWRSMVMAVQVLATGASDSGYMFDVVQGNAAVSILVTGLESYAKTRFLELETEGIVADWERAYAAFSSSAERASDGRAIHERQAHDDGVSVLRGFVDGGRINFQSFDQLKRAFRTAYGIRVGNLPLQGQTLSQLQQFIRHRHRVTHVSWIIAMLNEEAVPAEDPIFVNKETAVLALECFDEFVQALHQATLALRPPIPDGGDDTAD